MGQPVGYVPGNYASSCVRPPRERVEKPAVACSRRLPLIWRPLKWCPLDGQGPALSRLYIWRRMRPRSGVYDRHRRQPFRRCCIGCRKKENNHFLDVELDIHLSNASSLCRPPSPSAVRLTFLGDIGRAIWANLCSANHVLRSGLFPVV
jgi:hypothetical protein